MNQQSAPDVGAPAADLNDVLDLADQLDKALTAAERSARPDPEILAAIQRITRPATPART